MTTSVMKEMQCEQNLLKNTDGSAQFQQGETSVLVGVYGPADCKESKQNVKQAFVEVNFRPKIGIPGVAEKYHEQYIRGICETAILRSWHPRTLFSIIVQVMQDKGSLLSCAVNGVSMALQDAGVAMKFMPVAVSIALKRRPDDEVMDTNEGDTYDMLFNPSLKDEEDAFAIMTFTFDSARLELISSRSVGTVTTAQYERCLTAARDASRTVVKFFRDCVMKKVSADIR